MSWESGFFGEFEGGEVRGGCGWRFSGVEDRVVVVVELDEYFEDGL